MVKTFYNFVKKHPAVKLLFKNAYQATNIIFTRCKPDMHALQSVAENYFFGFHDKCPWDCDDRRVLAHRAPEKDAARIKGDAIEIGYFEDDSLSQFRPITETRAWNWQQGAMLQWDPVSDSIFFNDIGEANTPHLIKLGIKDSKREIAGPASAAISLNGRYSASISFFRFGMGLSGYGYFGIRENEGEAGVPKANGALKLYDISSSKPDLLTEISLSQCIKMKNRKSMVGAYHYTSHPQFSPDSTKLAFFHRWFHKGRRVETHLFFLDMKTGKLGVADTGSMFSHFCWINNHQIFGFYEDKNGIDKYGILDVNTVSESRVESALLSSDGHPNANWQTGKVITDTYPDKSRLQRLILLQGDLTRPTATLLGTFYAPFRFQEIFRADLHPRWNRRGDKIAIDCSFPGRRSLAVVKTGTLG